MIGAAMRSSSVTEQQTGSSVPPHLLPIEFSKGWSVSKEQILALYDRNVLSWLDRRPDQLALVLQAVDDGRVRFLYTHILDDELRRPPREEMARLTALRERLGGEYVPTRGWVWNVSGKFNESKFFDDKVADLYNTLRVAEPDDEGRINNARDALLTLTADDEDAVMLSDDIRLVSRGQGPGHRCCTSR